MGMDFSFHLYIDSAVHSLKRSKMPLFFAVLIFHVFLPLLLSAQSCINSSTARCISRDAATVTNTQ